MSPPTLSPLCFLFLILCLVMFHLSLSKLWGFSSLLHGSGICAGPRRILWRNFGGRSGSFRSGNQNVDESTVSIDLHSPRSSLLFLLFCLHLFLFQPSSWMAIAFHNGQARIELYYNSKYFKDSTVEAIKAGVAEKVLFVVDQTLKSSKESKL